MKPGILEPGDTRYPAFLRERLGADAPVSLSSLGNLDLLSALPETETRTTTTTDLARSSDEFVVTRGEKGNKISQMGDIPVLPS